MLQCLQWLRLALSHRWKVFNIVIPGPHYAILLFFAIHNCHQKSRSLCPGQKSGHNTGSIPTTSPLLATLEIVVMSGRGRRSGDTLQDWTHQRQKTWKTFLTFFVDAHARVLIFDYYTTQDAPLSATTLNDNEHQHKIQQKLCCVTLEYGFFFFFVAKKDFLWRTFKTSLVCLRLFGVNAPLSVQHVAERLVWILRSMPSTSSSPVFLFRLALISKTIFSILLTTC